MTLLVFRNHVFSAFYLQRKQMSEKPRSHCLGPGGAGGGGRGGLGLIFAGYVPLASQSPYPIIVYSVANYNLNEDELVTCAAWRFWSGAQTSQGG